MTDTSNKLVPTRPKHLEDSDESALKSEVTALVLQIQESPEDRQLARNMGNLGNDEQRKASTQIDLLKTRVGSLLDQVEGEGGEIPKGLNNLRATMNQINPHVLGQPGKIAKIFGRVPGIGKVLAKIAQRYETVQTQINVIMSSLRVGKDKLIQDNIDLETLYQHVQGAQLGIQEQAYLGEMILVRLDEVLPDTEDSGERQKIEAIMHRVSTRVQDMRTMEQVNMQFFISLDMTIQNNDILGDQVDRTIMVTGSLLTVGLAIQAALVSQKKIAKAVKATQDYTADLLVANAKSIRQQTIEIGDMQNNPVLALDKVKEAFTILEEAMDDTERIRREGTVSARAAISELTGMSESIAPKVAAIREAGKTARSLPSGTDLSTEEEG